MEVLSLNIMWTSLIFCLCSVGVMKFIESDELPFWVASATVITFFAGGAVALISLIVAIWI